MNWRDRTEVKKGDFAEALIDDYLCKNGEFIAYRPVFDGSHPFDRLVASRDRKKIFIADVKGKARRNAYPDTGIDIRHYDEYKAVGEKHNLDVFLFFVDEWLGRIYGNYLSVLDEESLIENKGRILVYPLRQGRQIYFPLAKMRVIAKLTSEQCRQLKELSMRTHDYGKVY